MSPTLPVRLEVNGHSYERQVEPRRTLADFLREDLGLKGTHLACEHGFCGNCNVLFDGVNVRSCLMFAVQANGHSVQTVESLAEAGGELDELQQAFREHAALQCGFCTPAMLLTAKEFLREHPGETDEREIRVAISGVLCRCTGYQQIVEAIQSVARVQQTFESSRTAEVE
jgi:carbon-monoxide dehydrogenase small subunit